MDAAADKRAKATAKELMRAIRAKCLECCNGQLAEARACFLADCPLYPYKPEGPPPPDPRQGTLFDL